MNFSKSVSETNTLIEMLMKDYMEFDELRCNTIMLKFDININILDMPVQFWTQQGHKEERKMVKDFFFCKANTDSLTLFQKLITKQDNS